MDPLESKQLFPSVSSSSNQNESQNDLNAILPTFSSFQFDPNSLQANHIQSKTTDVSSEDKNSRLENSTKHTVKNKSEKESRSKKRHHDHDHRHGHRKKKKHKDDEKKSKTRGEKRKKSSQNNDNSDGYDNSYLEHLPRSAIFIENIPNLRPEHAFRIDRRSDNSNRAFDSLNKYDVPIYDRRSVIDLEKLSRNSRQKGQKNRRYFELKKKDSKNYHLDHYLFPQASLPRELDYIRLIDFVPKKLDSKPKTNVIKFESLQGIDHHIDEHNSQYKKFIGPKNFYSPSQLIIELRKQFNRDLHTERRNDVKKWIDFVHFQDLIYHYVAKSMIEDGEFSTINNERKRKELCLNKKVDICLEALKYNAKSIELNRLHLQLIPLLHHKEDYDLEWQRLCFRLPEVPLFWFEWIYHSLKIDIVSDDYDREKTSTKKIFAMAFENIRVKLLEGDLRLAQDKIHFEWIIINLTLFYTEYLSSMDFTENAIGLFQALIEFNLNTPGELNFYNSMDEWYQCFDEFLSSSHPKIGEFSNSKCSGWKFYFDQQDQQSEENIEMSTKSMKNFEIFSPEKLDTVLEDEIVEKMSELKLKNRFENFDGFSWMFLERMRQHLNYFPQNLSTIDKTDEDEDEDDDDVDDCDRMAFEKENIQPFLYRLRNLESKFFLALKFLQFLRIPMVTHTLESAFSSSKFEQEFHLDSMFPIDPDCSCRSFAKLFERGERYYQRFDNYSELFLMRKFRIDLDLDEYSDLYRFKDIDGIQKRYEKFYTDCRRSFVENVFEKLCHIFESNRSYQLILLSMWIQYEIKLYRKKIITTSKMKKIFRDLIEKYTANFDDISIHLYNLYGQFMFEIDAKESIKIFLMTIKYHLMQKNNHGASVGGKNLNIQRLTLSFVRTLMNLDQILHRFILNELDLNEIEPKQQLAKDNDNQDRLTTIDLNNIASNCLITIFGDENGDLMDRFNLDSIRVAPKSIQILRAINTIKSRWHQHGKRMIEDCQAIILLIFLSKDLESSRTIYQQLLMPDSFESIEFQTQSYRIDLNRKNLERSFHLLQIQLTIREYVRHKKIALFSIESIGNIFVILSDK
ncbi:Protein NRDE2 -like protein [Sarcoptes scabiei]|uniref:Protein NRDE2 -like protein n=1 Tax=Sarcoptes scabiei TaxID=52283 RepID=A0A834R1U8_SARSC|nr:Protein NRDE2 -like protein [Sarcoptes scabiei]